MISYESGDIFEADVDAIVNTVNTVGVMGKGLALQFKRRYKANYEAYRAACEAGEVRLGRMFVTETHRLDGPRLIVNFPTKGHWKANSRLSDIRQGLRDLVEVIQDRGITSIAVPPLGAGNGGLNWADVKPVIAEALESLDGVRVLVFEPSRQHYAVPADDDVTLTPSLALMLDLMLAYSRVREAAEPWEDARGASHLEVQKLMYFASFEIPDLKLHFDKAPYGPYSDAVRIMLQRLEGKYTVGFGDGNDPVLDLHPIEVTDEGVRALDEFRDDRLDPEVIARTVNSVMGYIQGFEGAYPLELLATVRWAVAEIGTDAYSVAGYVRNWTPRKAKLFTKQHVEAALARVAV